MCNKDLYWDLSDLEKKPNKLDLFDLKKNKLTSKVWGPPSP